MDTNAGSDARMIATFMFFAVVFAPIGHTISPAKSSTGDVKIILGGMIGTVLLALLAETGETEAAFAKGLAGVTLLSSVLVNGAPVFKAIDSNVKPPATITPIKKAA